MKENDSEEITKLAKEKEALLIESAQMRSEFTQKSRLAQVELEEYKTKTALFELISDERDSLARENTRLVSEIQASEQRITNFIDSYQGYTSRDSGLIEQMQGQLGELNQQVEDKSVLCDEKMQEVDMLSVQVTDLNNLVASLKQVAIVRLDQDQQVDGLSEVVEEQRIEMAELRRSLDLAGDFLLD